MSQLMCPIVIKVRNYLSSNAKIYYCRQAIINFAKRKEQAKARGEPESNVGIGVVMAIGLFFLTVSASVGHQQVNFTSSISFIVLIRSEVLLALGGNWSYGSCHPCWIHLQARSEPHSQGANENIQFRPGESHIN